MAKTDSPPATMSLSEECLPEVIECIPDPVLVIDDRGVIETANVEAEQMFGWSASSLSGRPVEDLLPEGHRAKHAEYVRDYFLAPKRRPMGQVKRLLGRHASGKTLPLDISLRPVVVSGRHKVLCCPRDVGDRDERERRVEAIAQLDGLTGLLNRRAFLQRMKASIEASRERSGRVALVFVDLDRFKAINDTYGHLAGDRLIAEIARRISECLRLTDTLARAGVRGADACRFGGDEFVCLLEGIPDQRTAMKIAERIHAVFADPIDLGGFSIRASGSIGIALCPDHAPDAESLIQAADFAMYAAKEQGGGRVSGFDEKAHRSMQYKSRIQAVLPGAWERGEMSVVYQPIFCAGTHQVDALEALVRWTHPELGSVAPDDFIPIAEEIGEIHTIGREVLAEACRVLKGWRAAGNRLVRVWINWSPVQLRVEENVDIALEIARRHRIEPALLGLEITETAVLEFQSSSLRSLQRLEEAGFEIRLDDFGTGYSSLVHLCQLPAGGLKIDQGFVHDLETRESRDVCNTVLAVARSLGLSVTAEGVETQEQAAMLTKMGCQYLQGFLLGRPMSSADAQRCLGFG